MRKPEIAVFDDPADVRATLFDALKLLAEMQRNRSIAPAYKRDVDKILSSITANSVLLGG